MPDGRTAPATRCFASVPTQTWLATHDADHLNIELEGKTATVVAGLTVTAKGALFDISDHESCSDPCETDAAALLAAAIEEVSAA